jgi:hypothetical protein
MARYRGPLRVEYRTFQQADHARRNVVQAVEPEAEQLLMDAGGKVLRNHADYLYEEYWNCPFPTLVVIWPPNTRSVYLAPTGQEDDMPIFLAALLPVSQTELHVTYDYRPVFVWSSFEEFLMLRVARIRIFASG